MDDLHHREKLMQRDVLLVATAGASLLNGMHFSPIYDPVAILMKPFVAGTMFATPLVYLYITSIFCSLISLLIAGIPAAIYERINKQTESSTMSLGIWLVATLLVNVPAFLALMS